MHNLVIVDHIKICKNFNDKNSLSIDNRSVTLEISNFEISGKIFKSLQSSNNYFIFFIFSVFYLDILGIDF